MAKELTELGKESIAIFINTTRKILGQLKGEKLAKEAIAREQLYRKKGLPVEISDIIENEIWKIEWKIEKAAIETRYPAIRVTIPRLQDLNQERQKCALSEKQNNLEDIRENIKNLIWLIRLLRNEIQITERPPKNELALEIIESIFKSEKNGKELEKSKQEWEQYWEQEKQKELERKQRTEQQQLEVKQREKELEQEREKRKLELERQEKEREAEQARLREQKTTENKNNEEEKAKERRKAKLDQIQQEKDKLINNLKEAKEYAKDAYEWLPPKARYWVKIGICVIVIIAAIWGFKYIVRFSKWVFRFLKWIWNNIVEAIREIKSLFGKKKSGEKTPSKEKKETPTTDEKQEKKKGKNRRKSKKEK